MSQQQNKTVQTEAEVQDFIAHVEDSGKREDSETLLALMSEVTGEPAKMWGESMVGFGKYHYKYKSGREGDYFLAGFSPRKQNMTIYLMGIYDELPDLMDKLGKYKLGKSCLYIKRLTDIDIDVLRELVRVSVERLKQTDPAQFPQA